MSPFRREAPSPTTNADTSAVITLISGGIPTLKYGATSTARDSASTYSSGVIIEGKNIWPVAYDNIPAPSVAT